MARILVVDDDSSVRRVLRGLLEAEGRDVLTAGGLEEAGRALEVESPDLIITDLRMPGGSGMELLDLVRRERPHVPVVMITAHGDIGTAVAAMRKGAYDFITKPFDENELLNTVEKAVSESETNRELLTDYFETAGADVPEIVGRSSALKGLLDTVRKVAPTSSTVLITGETGVGKELIARAVHKLSPRRNGPLVKINCAAIPENLLESELFGYEKGAFSGAAASKPGKLEIADGGTVFLDEIGELPVHLQAKLLHVLQDSEVERLGAVRPVRVDMRVVAATNRDLLEAVNRGDFRADLFYRLNVVAVAVPPLRERKDDIRPLAECFLRKFSARNNKRITSIATEVLSAFLAYHWPGNIRELEHAMERMVVMAEEDVLKADHMPPHIRGDIPSPHSLKEALGDVSRIAEKEIIAEALARTGQNRTRAAEVLGISRRALQLKIKKYGL